jgi:hypothetical protein
MLVMVDSQQRANANTPAWHLNRRHLPCHPVAVYILTAMTTSPDKVGYDWIPLRILAVPWSAMAAQLLFAWVSD